VSTESSYRHQPTQSQTQGQESAPSGTHSQHPRKSSVEDDASGSELEPSGEAHPDSPLTSRRDQIEDPGRAGGTEDRSQLI
jgi:hypothetical protein